MALKEYVDTANAILTLVDKVRSEVSRWERGAVIAVKNNTDNTLEIRRQNILSGSWLDPPDYQIPPQKASLFSATSGGPGDCGGFLHYTILGVDPATYLQIKWNNPFVGGNDSNAWDYVENFPPDDWPDYLKQQFPVLPANSANFRTWAAHGSGDRAPRFEYELLTDP